MRRLSNITGLAMLFALLVFAQQADAQCTNCNGNSLEVGTPGNNSASASAGLAGGITSDINAGADNSIAYGNNTEVSGAESFSLGRLTRALGTNTFAFGNSAVANGDFSFAIGDNATTSSSTDNSYALGDGVTIDVGVTHSYVLGQNVTNSTVNSFMIGWGSPAMEVEQVMARFNGDVLVGANLEVPGTGFLQSNVAVNMGTTTPANIVDISGNAVIGSGFAGTNTAPPNGLLVEGDMGIGTSTVGSRLTIVSNGSSSSTSALDIQNSGGNTMLFVRDDGVVGINRTSVANIGIGVDLTVQGEAEKGAGTGAWQTISDKRLKKYTKPFKDGLNTLMEINPVRFKYNGKLNLPTKEEYIGVVAQEMKDIAPYMINENENGYLGYNANALWYILVNAVQEQQKQISQGKAQNKSLKQKMEKQQSQINDLREKVNALTRKVNGQANRFEKTGEENLNQKTINIDASDKDNKGILLQNRPNPYAHNTIIPYYLPTDFESANLMITNINGQMVKRINLEKKPGKGEITLQTEGLKGGQYLYSLIVDDRKIQTRKMVIE